MVTEENHTIGQNSTGSAFRYVRYLKVGVVRRILGSSAVPQPRHQGKEARKRPRVYVASPSLYETWSPPSLLPCW